MRAYKWISFYVVWLSLTRRRPYNYQSSLSLHLTLQCVNHVHIIDTILCYIYTILMYVLTGGGGAAARGGPASRPRRPPKNPPHAPKQCSPGVHMLPGMLGGGDGWMERVRGRGMRSPCPNACSHPVPPRARVVRGMWTHVRGGSEEDGAETRVGRAAGEAGGCPGRGERIRQATDAVGQQRGEVAGGERVGGGRRAVGGERRAASGGRRAASRTPWLHFRGSWQRRWVPWPGRASA